MQDSFLNNANTKHEELWVKTFSVDMPMDYRYLLNTIEGKTYWDGVKEIQFLGVLQAIETFKSYNFHEFCNAAIPIAFDGSSNFCVYRKENSSLNGIWVMDCGAMTWDDSVRIANNISELINIDKPLCDFL